GAQRRWADAAALLAHDAQEIRGVALTQDLRRAELLRLGVPGAPDGPGGALRDQVDEREAPDNHVSHSISSITSGCSAALCWRCSVHRGPTCIRPGASSPP